MQTGTKNILQVDHLRKNFGGLAAVSNCSLAIKKVLLQELLVPMDQVKQPYLI